MNIRATCEIGIIRAIILGFWIFSISLFLLMPYWIQFLYQEKSISVLAWPTTIDTQLLQSFEQKTGIKVYVRYFENNQELYAKMRKTKGQGYDLIMPSDYMVQTMMQEGLLKKIDVARLPFFAQLYPSIVNTYYDPGNNYTVPYLWNIYGIAINKDHFKEIPPASWALIFDKAIAQPHTCMIDDIRELALIAAQYLYGKQESPLTADQIEAIKKLLLQQKEWVDVYTEDRANYLLASRATPLAVILSGTVGRILPQFPFINFLIPQEGSFLVIDSFAMPSTTTKDELVYQFLNFLYEPTTMTHNSHKFGFLAPLQGVPPKEGGLSIPTDQQLKKLDFFRDIITKEQVSEILIALKS